MTSIQMNANNARVNWREGNDGNLIIEVGPRECQDCGGIAQECTRCPDLLAESAALRERMKTLTAEEQSSFERNLVLMRNQAQESGTLIAQLHATISDVKKTAARAKEQSSFEQTETNLVIMRNQAQESGQLVAKLQATISDVEKNAALAEQKHSFEQKQQESQNASLLAETLRLRGISDETADLRRKLEELQSQCDRGSTNYQLSLEQIESYEIQLSSTSKALLNYQETEKMRCDNPSVSCQGCASSHQARSTADLLKEKSDKTCEDLRAALATPCAQCALLEEVRERKVQLESIVESQLTKIQSLEDHLSALKEAHTEKLQTQLRDHNQRLTDNANIQANQLHTQLTSFIENTQLMQAKYDQANANMHAQTYVLQALQQELHEKNTLLEQALPALERENKRAAETNNARIGRELEESALKRIERMFGEHAKVTETHEKRGGKNEDGDKKTHGDVQIRWSVKGVANDPLIVVECKNSEQENPKKVSQPMIDQALQEITSNNAAAGLLLYAGPVGKSSTIILRPADRLVIVGYCKREGQLLCGLLHCLQFALQHATDLENGSKTLTISNDEAMQVRRTISSVTNLCKYGRHSIDKILESAKTMQAQSRKDRKEVMEYYFKLQPKIQTLLFPSKFEGTLRCGGEKWSVGVPKVTSKKVKKTIRKRKTSGGSRPASGGEKKLKVEAHHTSLFPQALLGEHSEPPAPQIAPKPRQGEFIWKHEH
jgi:hypothetical protein